MRLGRNKERRKYTQEITFTYCQEHKGIGTEGSMPRWKRESMKGKNYNINFTELQYNHQALPPSASLLTYLDSFSMSLGPLQV